MRLRTCAAEGKYCQFVLNEGGLPLLSEVLAHADTSTNLRRLARVAIENTHAWMQAHNIPVPDEYNDTSAVVSDCSKTTT
jgi:hypothetical protein